MGRALVATLLGALVLAGCATATSQDSLAVLDPSTAVATPAQPISASPDAAGADLAPARATTDLPTTPVSQLPPEAVTTLELIVDGGPFPYPKDGVTFQNRERILPPKKSGFYQEYTVITPGSDDRGARRIVAADDGGRFYTDDHYASFTEVVAG